MKKLVLLHGALGTKQQFNALRDELNQSFEVLTFEFAGHGGKAFVDSFSIKEFAVELEEFLLLTNSKKADVFGYSLGGYVALYLAHTHPNLLGKIMTLGTKFNWSPVEAFKEMKMLNPKKIEEKIPTFAETLKLRNVPNDWKKNMECTAQMMYELGKKPTLTEESLESIPNEVLVLRGNQDQMVTSIESQWACSCLKNGRFKELDGVEHPIEKVPMSSLTSEIVEFFG